MGDFNCNYLDVNNCPALKDQILLNGLIQTIKGPARVTENTETLIDLLYSTKPENLMNITTIKSPLSDHDIIACKRKVNNVKYENDIIACRDYTNYDTTKILNDLKEENMNTVYNSSNVNDA